MTHEQSQELALLRAQLDRIDDDILDQLERRLAVSLEIAAAKEAEGDRRLMLRPRRQAAILSGSRSGRSGLSRNWWRQVWRRDHGAQPPGAGGSGNHPRAL